MILKFSMCAGNGRNFLSNSTESCHEIVSRVQSQKQLLAPKVRSEQRNNKL